MKGNTAGVCLNHPDCPSDSLYWEPIRDATNRMTGNAYTCMVCDVHWIEWFETEINGEA